MDSFQGLTSKSPLLCYRYLAPSLIILSPCQSATRRTIDQSAGGKLRDKNTEESWALIKDLALYDVPNAFDRHLIQLENQVQCLMEAHLDPKSFVQVNKIASLYEICSGPYDTKYCMENFGQAFVNYASSRTEEARADFKQQQSEMPNKIDTFLKAIDINSYFSNNSSATIPRRRNKRRTLNIVKPELHTIFQMADNRTMEELLQAPTEGYGEAIVIPEINADHFEIKTNLLQLVQANPYHGFERENPHTHINNFKRITSTLKFKDVPNDVIKFMMFSYSLEGNARVLYDKEPPNLILTWEDLVNKFVNQLFPPSKTTHLNEISRFTQRFKETFGEAWERFKKMLRVCPHHGFTELAQIDTFYNGLNDNDQDLLNATAGGNLLSKTTREALQIIENKSKVCYSRNKPNVSRMNTTSRDNATVKESCVTCGGNHAYYNCPHTDSNQPSVCVATGTYNQVAPQNRASNFMAPPGFALVQNGQNRFNQNQGQGNNFNLGNNFQPFQVPNQGFQKNDQKLHEKATNQMEKFFQIFQDLHFDISFADALHLMLKFASTIKSLLMNKDKLFELAKIPLNENCSSILLKKLPENLRDPRKFLISCDFPGMDVCHTLADLDVSINLMPLSI
nr:reverse transcriptase domain-containing protein [Tanacetum cinerariifolium]